MTEKNDSVIVIQRCVPHYRHILFQRLYERFGWLVVAASNFPSESTLRLVDEPQDYLRTYAYQFRRPGDHYRCIVPVSRVIQELRPRAIIAEFSLRMSSTYDLVWRSRTGSGPPVVLWGHGYNMEQPTRGLRSLAQWPRIPIALLADGHAVYSQEGKDFLCRFVDPDRVWVVRNTLALANPAPAPRRAFGGAALISVGRFSPEKQFPALVRVFKQLRRHVPHATLTIVGNGPDDARVRAEAGNLLDRSVFLPGAIYDEYQISSRFAEADVAVFAGAVGLSVNHALLHGVPVIAFDRTNRGPYHHPEIAYVVDRVTGLRVRPFHENAMVDALATFLQTHPDPRREFRERIDAFVKEHLLIDRMVEDFGRVGEMIETHS